MKLLVNLFDSEFDHSLNQDGFYTASWTVKPTLIEYIKNQPVWDGITLFTERHLHRAKEVQSNIKVAWLLESPGIHHWSVDAIVKYEDDYDLILTTVPELLSRGEKYKRFTTGSCRVKQENRNPSPNKEHLCSIIASNKTQTEGHRFRHEVIKSCTNFDVWGGGYKRFEDKEDALQSYKFSVCIMNVKAENYFTEIITDCFFLGTVPIFWGCPNIGEFFDEQGILTFNTIEDLQRILGTLNDDLFHSMKPHIKNNYNIAQDYISTDDIVAKVLIDNIPHDKISPHHYL